MVTNFHQEEFWNNVYRAKPQSPQRKATMRDLFKRLGVFAPLRETLFGRGLSGLGIPIAPSDSQVRKPLAFYDFEIGNHIFTTR